MNRKTNSRKINTVRWNLTSRCNYSCSYCITNPVRNFDTGQNIPTLDFVDRFFDILSGEWNVSLEGLGEPFCAPDFLKAVKKLSDNGYYISLSTNFSFSYADIDRFIQTAKDNLLNMGVSLHLEYVEPKSFLDKVFYFNKIIPGKIFVKYVATERGMGLLDEVSNALKKHNIRLLVNAERIETEKGLGYSRFYSRKELAKIRANRSTFWQDISFIGKLCWTGCKHFVVGEDGSAHRCAPARTYDSKKCSMGNIFDKDFKLLPCPTPCMVPNCYCSFSWLCDQNQSTISTQKLMKG